MTRIGRIHADFIFFILSTIHTQVEMPKQKEFYKSNAGKKSAKICVIRVPINVMSARKH